MSEHVWKILNVLVLVGVCVAGYYYLRPGPIEPPDDTWFQTEVINRPEPVLVKFGATWCGPCRMMESELDRFAGDLHGLVPVVRVDVDQHPQLAQHYRVSSIPRLMLFKNGQVVADRVGFVDHSQLQGWVISHTR